MAARTGSALLPLHLGRIPSWLAHRTARLGRLPGARLVGATALLLAACGKTPPTVQTGSAATPETQLANAAVAEKYALGDRAGFVDAERGFLARPSGHVLDAAGGVVWDFDGFSFVKDAAPPTVNPSLWRQALLNNNVGLYAVTDGIWQLRGFDLANITLIAGETGWIVVDTLTCRETAAAAMAFARQHLGDKPVSAIVFTHSHIDHFGGALGVLSAEEAAARKVPIVAPSGFLEEATSENLMMGVAMGRRAVYMYGGSLPRSSTGAVDTGLGKAVALGEVGVLPPTVLIESTPQEVVLDGVRFVFQNVPGSEAPAELTFYLPERRAYCGGEMLSHTLHNLYTLRGAKVRDALKWAGYIDQALIHASSAEVYFGQHHWPVWGRARIDDFITKQRDVYRYIHDQTVRSMNAGLTAPEIAEEMRLPPSLDSHLGVHGYYGTVKHNVRGVYQQYLGWFDGNPANLDPHPPVEAARRYVELAGGADKAIAAAQVAYDRADYRWAAELLKHVVLADGNNAKARALQAAAFEQLGYAAESAPWRNFYLTGARELREGPPKKGASPEKMIGMLQHTPIERFLDVMATNLNGPKAESASFKINLKFSDTGESHRLWIENAVMHHDAGPPAADATATLTVTKAFFLRMITGRAGADDLLLSDQTHIEGSRIDLGRFFALFDRAPGTFDIVARRR
jgi:alkyl sulfatase BDS1-like metallo-beta-lactamase superfamily hydrolase